MKKAIVGMFIQIGVNFGFELKIIYDIIIPITSL